ncbi:unnamed protein product, partial [Gulo gulo]
MKEITIKSRRGRVSTASARWHVEDWHVSHTSSVFLCYVFIVLNCADVFNVEERVKNTGKLTDVCDRLTRILHSSHGSVMGYGQRAVVTGISR